MQKPSNGAVACVGIILLMLACIVFGALGKTYGGPPGRFHTSNSSSWLDRVLRLDRAKPAVCIWDEMYDAFAEPERFDGSAEFCLQAEWVAPGLWWCRLETCRAGDSFPGLQDGDFITLHLDTDRKTLSFCYHTVGGACCSYTYRVRQNCLVEDTSDENLPQSFLYALILPTWIDRSGGYSDFSYEEWGEYRMQKSNG